MIKINLNELRNYNVLVYDGLYSEVNLEMNEYLPSEYYFCGFIEDVFTKNGEIIFKVYGSGYPREEELKHTEVKLHMKDIDVYEKIVTETYDIHKELIEYEYINIKTSESYSYSSYHCTDNIEYRLYKNLDFRFLMRRFYELIPHDNICTIEMAMLEDPYVLNKVTIPDDYEFSIY